MENDFKIFGSVVPNFFWGKSTFAKIPRQSIFDILFSRWVEGTLKQWLAIFNFVYFSLSCFVIHGMQPFVRRTIGKSPRWTIALPRYNICLVKLK